MTIRRQYQLPNCSLILDGLSVDPTPGNEAVMSVLVNAECRISGLERSLNGGYEFFAALVRAVSQYAQEILSGFAHPQVVEGGPLLVHINPGDSPYHHLVVQPEIADLGSSSDGRAIDIKLSAVQLFDLAEAVDQFFDDSQTLPELVPALAPLPRRFVRADEPLSDRALPAALGIGGLVAATLLISLLPVPKVREPGPESQAKKPAEVTSAEAETTPPAGDGTAPKPDGIALANLESPLWEEAPAITDEGELAALQQQLEDQIEENLDPAARFSDPLDYRVAVNEAGEVVGYQFNNDAALRDVEETPLPAIAAAAANAQGLEKKAIAQYQVAFDSDGVAVKPWQDSASATTLTPAEPAAEVAEAKAPEAAKKPPSNTASTTFAGEPTATLRSSDAVESLNNQLRRTLVENREQPRIGQTAAYRVRVNEDGTITGYEPVDQSAVQSVAETPLPDLVKSVPAETPAVDYRVVFTERGVIEVSPWEGWSYYE